MKRAAGERKALPKSAQCNEPQALSLDDAITHLTPYYYLLNGDGVLGEVYVENQTYEQGKKWWSCLRGWLKVSRGTNSSTIHGNV
jgi:hypothetical protein